jgi:hypothetical protein
LAGPSATDVGLAPKRFNCRGIVYVDVYGAYGIVGEFEVERLDGVEMLS